MPPSVPAASSRRPPLTHFLCLPLTTASSTPHLRAALQSFALDVAQEQDVGSGGSGSGSTNRSANGPEYAVKHGVTGKPGAQKTVPPRAIRPPGAIHLTIGVMSLLTPEKVREACKFLEEMDVKTIIAQIAATASTGARSTEARPAPRDEQQTEKGKRESSLSTAKDPSDHADPATAPSLPNAPPIRITLTSLLPMHLPDRTSTLYATPSPQQPILLPFAQVLHDAFVEAGYLLPPPSVPVNPDKRRRGQGDGRRPRELKLHATIVNTIYAGKDKGKPPPFPTSSSRENRSVNDGQPRGGSRGAEPAGTGEMGCSAVPIQTSGAVSEGRQEEGDGGESKVDDGNGDDDGTAEPRWKASNQRRSKQNRKILLDARDLIDRYREHVWIPEFRLDRVAICEMGARKVYADSEAEGHRDTEDKNQKSAEGKRGVLEKQAVDEIYVEVFTADLP